MIPLPIRIIPRLDVKGPNLVKGINFEGLRVLGKPESFAQLYASEGADELLYIDTVASLYGRNSLHDIVSRTADSIFIPIIVGGGLRTVEDIRQVLRAGADRVAINTAAVKRPALISEAAEVFGESTIVVSIEIQGGEVFIDYGRQETGIDAAEWAQQAAELGAGELLVTSISHDGTGLGLDLAMIKKIVSSVRIPVIAGGGVGYSGDIVSGAAAGVGAIAIASALHYNAIDRMDTDGADYTEGNIEYLSKNQHTHRGLTIPEIKAQLSKSGIHCRMEIV